MGFEDNFDNFENMQPNGLGFEEQKPEEADLMAGVKARRMRRMNPQSRRDRLGRKGYSPDGESDVDIMSPDKPVRISEGRRSFSQQLAQGVVSERSEFAYLYSNTEPQDVHMSAERSERLDALAYNDQSGEQYDTILNDQSPTAMVRTRSAIGSVPDSSNDFIGYPTAADYGYPTYQPQNEPAQTSSRFTPRSSYDNQEVRPEVNNNNYYQPQPEYQQPEQSYDQQPQYSPYTEPSYAQPEPAYTQPDPAYAQTEPAYVQAEPAVPAKYQQQFYPPYAEEYPVYPQYPAYPQYPQPYPYGGYPTYPQYPQYPVYPQPYPVYPQPQYVQPVQPVQPCVQLFVNTASQPYAMPQQYPVAQAPLQAPQQETRAAAEQPAAPAAEPTPAPTAYSQPETNVQTPYTAFDPIPVVTPPVYSSSEQKPYSYTPPETASNPYAYKASDTSSTPYSYKAPETSSNPYSYNSSDSVSNSYSSPYSTSSQASSDPTPGLYTAFSPLPETKSEPVNNTPYSYSPTTASSEPTSFYQPEAKSQTDPVAASAPLDTDFLFGLRREEPASQRSIPADIQEMMKEGDNSAPAAKSSRFNRRNRSGGSF